MITQQIEAEADVRVQMSSVRPGINEICRYVRHCPSSHSDFFCFGKYSNFTFLKNTLHYRMVGLSFLNEIKIFSVLISNAISIRRHNPHRQKLSAVLSDFQECKKDPEGSP